MVRSDEDKEQINDIREELFSHKEEKLPEWVLKFKVSDSALLPNLDKATETRLEVLEAVWRTEKAYPSKIGRVLNRDSSNVSKYLSDLKEQSLVNKVSKDGLSVHFCEDKAVKILKVFLHGYQETKRIRYDAEELNRVVRGKR